MPPGNRSGGWFHLLRQLTGAGSVCGFGGLMKEAASIGGLSLNTPTLPTNYPTRETASYDLRITETKGRMGTVKGKPHGLAPLVD